jgi:hypothetical protein
MPAVRFPSVIICWFDLLHLHKFENDTVAHRKSNRQVLVDIQRFNQNLEIG